MSFSILLQNACTHHSIYTVYTVSCMFVTINIHLYYLIDPDQMVSLFLMYNLGLVSNYQVLYTRKTDDFQKSYFVILYMDKSNGISGIITTLVTLFIPSFCSNPNALGLSIFNDDLTGRWMNATIITQDN